MEGRDLVVAQESSLDFHGQIRFRISIIHNLYFHSPHIEIIPKLLF